VVVVDDEEEEEGTSAPSSLLDGATVVAAFDCDSTVAVMDSYQA
jgi:hypothetical protein